MGSANGRIKRKDEQEGISLVPDRAHSASNTSHQAATAGTSAAANDSGQSILKTSFTNKAGVESNNNKNLEQKSSLIRVSFDNQPQQLQQPSNRSLLGKKLSGEGLILNFLNTTNNNNISVQRSSSFNEEDPDHRNPIKAVLEWMDTAQDIRCPALSVNNVSILEDIFPVIFQVMVYGNSDSVRRRLFRFVVDCSKLSVYYGFLVICGLRSVAQNKGLALHPAEEERANDAAVADLDNVLINLQSFYESLVVPSTSPTNGNSNSVSAEDIKIQAFASDTRLTSAIATIQKVRDSKLLSNVVRHGGSKKVINDLIDKVYEELNRSGTDGRMIVVEIKTQIEFIDTLTSLNEWLLLIEREKREEKLREAIEKLSKNIPKNIFIPTMSKPSNTTGLNGLPTNDIKIIPHRVLKLSKESMVFNTAKKCPFLLAVEIETYPDFESLKAAQENGTYSTLGLMRRTMKQFSSSSRKNSQRPKTSTSSRIESNSKNAEEKAKMGNIEEDPDTENEEEIDEDDDENFDTKLDDDDEEDDNLEKLSSDLTQTDDPEDRALSSSNKKWETIVERAKTESEFGSRKNWSLEGMFVKAADDLRQDQLGILLITILKRIWEEENVPVYLDPYKIIPTSPSTGIMQPVRNSDSIARIKQQSGGYESLFDHFLANFGPSVNTPRFKRARANFLSSLAGYSLVSYILKLHDRHNGNMLIDNEGHILHIDFGFMLGHIHRFERAPFKLTYEMVEVLGGPMSQHFQTFRRIMEKGLIAASARYEEVLLVAKLMQTGSSCPCYGLF